MKIVSIRDKRLRRYFYFREVAGLQPDIVRKLKPMLSFLQLMSDEDELSRLPQWKPHKLTGDLAGCWSLSVTRNWRLIFEVHKDEIRNLDLIDYH